MGDEAAQYRAIADASNPLLQEREPETPSALEAFGGPGQAAEDTATLKRLLEKRDTGEQLHRSERQWLAKHEG